MTDFKAIYELLDTVNPLKTDCGLQCNAACCRQDASEEEMGIYLLPGEASIHDKSNPWLTWSEEDPEESGFPESWTEPVDFVCCHGPETCNRKMRPIQCRTYPLTPHLTEDGKLYMLINDMELPYECPLVKNFDRIEPEFIEVSLKAWKELIKDKRVYDLVYEDSRIRDEESDFYYVNITDGE
ncbi:MAG: hypothetical protein Q4B67_05115 [Eubacteriales bacterium]|nr:hypothetical protein [Eubacteriales bacterium]